MAERAEKASLLLADGTVFEGVAFGAPVDAIGELVFTTAMVGYVETLSDPGCFGQLVVDTFPLAGNYGTMVADFESRRLWAGGFIVREWCREPSNFRCEGDLDSLLRAQGVPGICGIDTRRLTKLIRSGGAQAAMITTQDLATEKDRLLAKLQDYKAPADAVSQVTRKDITTHAPKGEKKYRVSALDLGITASTLAALTSRGCEVTLYPASTDPARLLADKPDGLFLSGGPGNPADMTALAQGLKTLAASGLPLMAVDLGHQLLAMAHGAKTIRLPHGHRGGQPVKDLAAGTTTATSQNHSYAVDGATLPAQAGQVSHVNINDGSCEGICYRDIPAFSTQFIPDGCARQMVGTAALYTRFTAMMDGRDK